LWGRANRKPVIAADFLGDPTGTRVGHAISRCSAVYGEVIPDQPSRTATRSRSCIGSIGDPHGTHQREHGRLWRGHSRPAQPHGNFDLDRA
jgi:hypothetical protein